MNFYACAIHFLADSEAKGDSIAAKVTGFMSQACSGLMGNKERILLITPFTRGEFLITLNDLGPWDCIP